MTTCLDEVMTRTPHPEAVPADSIADAVRLRPARPADLPALGTLVEQAVRTLGAPDYSAQEIDSALRHGFGQDTPALVAEGTYYVAEADGRIVGSGGWSRRRALHPGERVADETTTAPLDPRTDAAKIRAFFVHPAWARHGIGRRLLEACEAAARHAGFRRLELLATRTGEPLYTKVGFRVRERLGLTLPDGVVFACAKMEKVLG